MTGWISNIRTYARGGQAIASKFQNTHKIPWKLLNQPFQKVQRDIEPGGHDAGDRDGADQLDLPNHLRPRHLPAVQPPSLLWRISGDKKFMMNMIRMNLAGTSFCHVCHDAKTLFLSHHFQSFSGFWHWHSGENWSHLPHLLFGPVRRMAGQLEMQIHQWKDTNTQIKGYKYK